MRTIIGIELDNRIEEAIDFQKIITTYGCGIKTRIGLHDTVENHCLNSGIILLELIDDSAETLFFELSKKWKCQKMVF